MTRSSYFAILLALAAPLASAQAHHETDATAAGPAEILISLPSEIWPMTDWYKQNVYDTGDNKIGEIKDVLLDHDGKSAAVIVGVGGFLGVGEKDVAVAFKAVHFKMKDNKWYLVMNASKDALKNAPGYKYDRSAMKWMPEAPAATIGGSQRR